MSNKRVTLSEVIRRAIDSRLLDAWTNCPGVVHKYNAAKRSADIKLVTKRPIDNAEGETVFETIAILPEVRVAFPGLGSDNYIVWPLAVGDGGLLHFSMFDASNWVVTGNEGDPAWVDSHLIQSAFFVPNLAPDTVPVLAAAQNAMSIVASDLRLGDYVAGNLGELALHENLTSLAETIAGVTPVPNDGGAAIIAAVASAMSAWLGSTVKGKKAT